MTQDIRATGMFLRLSNNAWRFHSGTKSTQSSMVRYSDYPITLPDCEPFYTTRKAATEAAEAADYIVTYVNDHESSVSVDMNVWKAKG